MRQGIAARNPKRVPEVPRPCDTCPHIVSCAADGTTCRAFDVWTDERRWREADRVPKAARRRA